MRDNYVGDVGDFYKYGLLRQLSNNLRLGVVWYLYPGPCKDTDGLHLAYLSDEKKESFYNCDPELHQQLSRLILDGERNVQEIQARGILPRETCFYDEPLSLADLTKGSKEAISIRIKHRQNWLNGALEATKNCELIFFDPDNGLEVKSTAIHHDKGAKFTFYRELIPFWERGQSLVVYQHKNLHEKATVQIQNRVNEIQDNLRASVPVQSIYFSSYGGRIFFVVMQKKHQNLLSEELSKFKVNWESHIKL